MLVKIRDLVNISDEKYYEVNIDLIEANNNPYLRRLTNNTGFINFYYDYSDKLRIEYELKGEMVCPDAVNLKDVVKNYELTSDEEVTFDENMEGFYISGDIDLKDLVYSIVSPEAPIIVENCDKTRYYSGDGWSIMSEEEYDKNQKNKLDPRLQVLKDYKEEK